MPIEVDLSKAYRLLYDEKQPEKALELYDKVLKQSKDNLVALIYKAASLEKLYYSSKSWHNEITLTTANELLSDAMKVAEQRGDRAKLALVNFRFFVHMFNRHDYSAAKTHFKKAKELGYKDDTLTMWETSLAQKLEKLKLSEKVLVESNKEKTSETERHVPEKQSEHMKVRTEWYQSSQQVTISLFTSSLPSSSESVSVDFVNDTELEVSYPVNDMANSTFYKSIILAHPVEPSSYNLTVMRTKFELTFNKKDKIYWKVLERDEQLENKVSTKQFSQLSEGNQSSTLKYPSSSKKKIDWQKLDTEDNEDEQEQSADSFFQSLYANADPDTKRAMMKSFIESNGTSLNTSWDEVSKGKVETSLPEGVEIKEF
ncbi:co-chaperone SGT1 Ecym_5476 [Eremothecium cymbalariae DBVPG|uniref:CS domain-containing protein n=1 Tax=Eremothecium cymbalariae (strain CBS 270.75 / DBVPG 7215 / KCTC 17166 / NRRL Y-17582) TaxID=931890 RepID=I6NDT0_ERECY|nr:hypothetical protein Ecym_5476 [Eremothecium cymbalariae DBVPG\